MDYAALVWGSAGVTVLDELQDMQTKTLERLLQLKGLDDVTLHYKANMQFLDCRRKEQLLITLFNGIGARSGTFFKCSYYIQGP